MFVDLPVDHPVQALSDAVHEAVATQTPLGLTDPGAPPRVVIAARPFTGTQFMASPAAYSFPKTRHIAIAPWAAGFHNTAARLGGRATLTPHQQEWVQVLVHEHLHQTKSGLAALSAGGHHAAIEEAAVDTVAADLTPLVLRTIGARAGAAAHRTPPGTAYSRCVVRIRQASTVATRARSWRDSGAAMWRMRLLLAPPGERIAMLARTGTGPEVCS